MKYVGFYFLTGGVISVSLLVAALWIHRHKSISISWLNALGQILGWSILWPLWIFHPDGVSGLLLQFIRPGDSAASWNAIQKARRQALLHPPYCSNVVSFDTSTCCDANGAQGLLQFPADVVESEIKALVSQNPNLMHEDEGCLLAWLHNRRRDDQKPVPVPGCWPRVIHTLDALLRAGHGSAYCPLCREEFNSRQLTTGDESGHNGWNHNQLFCPAGHLLLRRKRMHILKPRHKIVEMMGANMLDRGEGG